MINAFGDELSQKAQNILYTLSNQEKSINHKQLNLIFDFRDYRLLKELFRDIYYKTFTIEEAERIKDEFTAVLDALKKYNPKNPDNIKGNIFWTMQKKIRME